VWKEHVIKVEQNILQEEVLRRHVEYHRYTDKTRVQQERRNGSPRKKLEAMELIGLTQTREPHSIDKLMATSTRKF
jgi:hypothetical protein